MRSIILNEERSPQRPINPPSHPSQPRSPRDYPKPPGQQEKGLPRVPPTKR